ncbi:hypothetical protein GHT07_20615 [Caenimonas koreensis DSM 17982]|uniref:Uncharacterized protein n=1 Tax=Caenimonas koreensis DSM 17982 TaxID=1121255 RepID=A0A844AYP7_9BURK|nr:hypothetical protein [Caenimonas koreensis]MRD49680.1 hypothetical protein [Caenimonas koreensis DSM 17982]
MTEPKRPLGAEILLGLGVLAFIVSLVLLLSDRRILVYEHKVNPGESFVEGEWGDLGKASQSQLVCRYFTGRSVQTTVYWHAPNNIMGKDQCPFLSKGE